MKKNFQVLLIALLLLTLGCSKEEVPSHIGTWEGVQYQTIKTDGVLTSETTLNMELVLMESGSGNLTRQFGFDGKIHWVVDEIEDVIFIITEIDLNGSNISVTDKFEMIVNTDSEQKWEQTKLYQLPTGEENETFIRWSLLKE